MKILKLGNNTVLGRNGFRHGIRFMQESQSYHDVIVQLENMHGMPWRPFYVRGPEDDQWAVHRSYQQGRLKLVWVGVKNAQDLSMVMLALPERPR